MSFWLTMGNRIRHKLRKCYFTSLRVALNRIELSQRRNGDPNLEMGDEYAQGRALWLPDAEMVRARSGSALMAAGKHSCRSQAASARASTGSRRRKPVRRSRSH